MEMLRLRCDSLSMTEEETQNDPQRFFRTFSVTREQVDPFLRHAGVASPEEWRPDALVPLGDASYPGVTKVLRAVI
jgi:hypothetical protein